MKEVKPTVFVVDDDAAVRDSLRMLLKSVGLPVEVFESGQEFLDAALETLHSIAKFPSMYPVGHRSTRRALISRFPFGLYYREDEPHIVVLAAMHGSRHPNRWKQRR